MQGVISARSISLPSVSPRDAAPCETQERPRPDQLGLVRRGRGSRGIGTTTSIRGIATSTRSSTARRESPSAFRSSTPGWPIGLACGSRVRTSRRIDAPARRPGIAVLVPSTPFHAGEFLDRRGCDKRLTQLTRSSSRHAHGRPGRPLPGTFDRLRGCSANLKADLPADREYPPPFMSSAAGQGRRRRPSGSSATWESICLHSDCPGEAIDPLQTYLENQPDAEDAETSKKLLDGGAAADRSLELRHAGRARPWRGPNSGSLRRRATCRFVLSQVDEDHSDHHSVKNRHSAIASVHSIPHRTNRHQRRLSLTGDQDDCPSRSRPRSTATAVLTTRRSNHPCDLPQGHCSSFSSPQWSDVHKQVDSGPSPERREDGGLGGRQALADSLRDARLIGQGTGSRTDRRVVQPGPDLGAGLR